MIDQNKPLIFMHIPKTGGMSMFASMCEYHGMKIADMYDMSALDQDRKPVTAVLSDPEKSVYAGHFPFGLHEWLNRPAYYMAFVRKPIDRILSLYYYSIQYRKFIRNTRKESGESWNEIFTSKKASDFYMDFTPWIKGQQTITNFIRCRSPELDNGMVRRFSGIGLNPYPCPKDALDLAKENIEKYFSVIGIQERYPESIDMVSSVFNVNLSEFHVNKGTDKQDQRQKISIANKQRIKQMNRMDIELYHWIQDRFEECLAKPPSPIAVHGGFRTDYENAKLWHAIGSSPIRKRAMELSPANYA